MKSKYRIIEEETSVLVVVEKRGREYAARFSSVQHNDYGLSWEPCDWRVAATPILARGALFHPYNGKRIDYSKRASCFKIIL